MTRGDHLPETSEKNLRISGAKKAELTSNEKIDSLSLSYEGFLKNKSDLTAKVYHATTEEFLSFISQNYKIRSISELSRNHIIFYKSHLIEKKNSDKTILKKLSAVSSLCSFLAFEGLIEKDICYGVSRPKTQNKKETADLTDDEVKLMLSSLDPKSHSYPLHHAILAVGFYTGLRSAEIRNLRVGAYGRIDGHMVLRTKIKGSKIHTVPLNPVVIRAIDDLIARKKELGHQVEEEDYLFSSLKYRLNKPIQPNSLKYVFDKALREAGIDRSSSMVRYSPHSMRATIASHLLNDKEVPLEDVQRLLGHSSPTTTQRYNKRLKSYDKSPVYKIEY